MLRQQPQSPLNHTPPTLASDLEPGAVGAYLSRLERELSPLPSDERETARVELRQHVDALIAAHGELGLSAADAQTAALAQFGDARKIGGKLRREYRLTLIANNGGPRALRYATLWAVVAHLATWFCAFLVGSAFEKTLSNAASLGDATALGLARLFYLVFLGLFFVAGPAVAGIVAETRAPRQGARAVAHACVVSATVTASIFAFVEAGYRNPTAWASSLAVPFAWLPVGLIAACATGRAKRRKTRLKTAR